jgi:hypothetical protein
MRAATVVPLLAAASFAVGGARPAHAFEGFESTRALAMGGSTRAFALGDTALFLNPSGMSLARAYNVEASYQYGSRLSEHFLHASIVDSTSELSLAGGIYYTYHLAEPAGVAGRGHEVGGALALPVGPYVSIGATVKWLRLEGADDHPGAPLASTSSGLTGDGGITVRPTEILSLAVVGANLFGRERGQMPRSLGYGAALLPVSTLLVALDGVTTFTYDDYTGRRGTGVRAGAEVSMAQRVAIRAGGGTDPALGTGYLSAGVSFVSPQVGAVDVGARGDLFPYATGATRHVFAGVSLRLFVPDTTSAAQGQQQPP